jgi:hypothetical protein
MRDPTYVKADIEANPVWDLAFVLSEILNDGAPIGWSKYISTAECLLAHYEIKRLVGEKP